MEYSVNFGIWNGVFAVPNVIVDEHIKLAGATQLKVILWMPGVPFFCCLTGFLIWPSIGRSKSFGDYCKKRFWRLYERSGKI